MSHLVLVSHTGRNKTVKILVSVWIQLTPAAQLLPEAPGLHEDIVIDPPLLPGGGGPGLGLGVQVEGVVRGHFQTWVQASHSQIIFTRGVNIISQNVLISRELGSLLIRSVSVKALVEAFNKDKEVGVFSKYCENFR